MRIRLISLGLRFKTGESGESPARLDLDRRLRTEAFGLSRKMTLTGRRAGSNGWSGYLIRQRMQTAYWQFCFSDRFTGARNPARLPTPIQSRRIRCAPISLEKHGGYYNSILASAIIEVCGIAVLAF